MIRRLKAAWSYLKFAPYIEEADSEDFWTEDDATNLARFFSSYTGKKLKMRLTNYVTKAATNAVQKQGDYAHNAGVAFGISLGINAISEHFPPQQSVSADHEQPEAKTALDALAQEQAV